MEMDKYFDLESIKDENKVQYSCIRLKGHASLRWDQL